MHKKRDGRKRKERGVRKVGRTYEEKEGQTKRGRAVRTSALLEIFCLDVCDSLELCVRTNKE